MKVLKPSRKNSSRDKEAAEKILDQHSGLTTGNSLNNFSDEFETDALRHGLGSQSNDKKTREGKAKRAGKGPGKASGKSEYDILMHKAIHLLSMREHSVKELQDKLSAKSEDADTVLAVMDFLLENDYVSDTRFTEAFIRSKANRGHGPIKIRAELRGKGVSSLMIDEYLDASAGVWFDNAAQLYDKKYGEEPVSDYNTWSKRARFLQGRGFTMDHIQSTVPQVDYDNS